MVGIIKTIYLERLLGSFWQLINEKPDSLARVAFLYQVIICFFFFFFDFHNFFMFERRRFLWVLHIIDCVALAAWASIECVLLAPKKTSVGCTQQIRKIPILYSFSRYRSLIKTMNGKDGKTWYKAEAKFA